MTVRILTTINAHFLHLVVRWKICVLLASFLVAELKPSLLIAALGERFLLAHALGDFTQIGVQRAPFELRRGDRLAHDDKAHVAGIVVRDEVRLLDRHKIGQQHVGVLGGIGHERFPHHDELALAFVLQDLVRAIDVAVLVRDRVARVVEDHLDGHIELVLAAHAMGEFRHLGAVIDGISPGEGSDRRLHRVFVRRHRERREIESVKVGTRVAAVDAYVARENRQHADGACRLLAIRLALRTLALVDGAGFRSADLACQLDNGIGGNPRNTFGPCGRFLDAVYALTHDVGFVRLVLPLRRFRHGILVVTDAVGGQKVVIH